MVVHVMILHVVINRHHHFIIVLQLLGLVNELDLLLSLLEGHRLPDWQETLLIKLLLGIVIV